MIFFLFIYNIIYVLKKILLKNYFRFFLIVYVNLIEFFRK